VCFTPSQQRKPQQPGSHQGYRPFSSITGPYPFHHVWVCFEYPCKKGCNVIHRYHFTYLHRKKKNPRTWYQVSVGARRLVRHGQSTYHRQMFSHSYYCVRAYHNFGKRRKGAVLPDVGLTELEHAGSLLRKEKINPPPYRAYTSSVEKQSAKDYTFLFWLSCNKCSTPD